ncbi:MAG: hypothetical protein ACRCUM_03710 [Mycoplasmoidaceae bacterium]
MLSIIDEIGLIDQLKELTKLMLQNAQNREDQEEIVNSWVMSEFISDFLRDRIKFKTEDGVIINGIEAIESWKENQNSITIKTLGFPSKGSMIKGPIFTIKLKSIYNTNKELKLDLGDIVLAL